MRTTVQLTPTHHPLITRFINLQKEPALGSPMLVFDQDNIAWGVIKNGSTLEQAFFVSLSRDHAFTHHIIGSYTDQTTKIFNLLCSTCVSRTPVIEHHTFNVPEDHRYNFLECFKRSRLYGFLESIEETPHRVEISVAYPLADDTNIPVITLPPASLQRKPCGCNKSTTARLKIVQLAHSHDQLVKHNQFSRFY